MTILCYPLHSNTDAVNRREVQLNKIKSNVVFREESFSQSQPTFEEVSNESCESSPIHCGQRKVLLPLTLPPVHIFNRHAYLFLLQWIVLDLVPTFFFALGGAAGGGYSQVIPMEEVRPSNHLQSCACVIGLFGKYHNNLCLSPPILHKPSSLLGLTMVPRENKNNACAKFWGDKQRVLWCFPKWPIYLLC